MKKKSIKDFMEEYETKELEKLVLVKGSVSAIKTCLEKYWTDDIEILAMADVCTGKLVSDGCYMNWPLTDAEEQTNEYSNRFSEGGIYRVLVRMNKREKIRLKSWYVTKVLEENVSCLALEEVWMEYSKPIVIEDEVIGRLTMNKEVNVFKGRCKWSDKEISVILEVNPNSKAWYDDDDIFWGHSIAVEASLKKGPQSADIEG